MDLGTFLAFAVLLSLAVVAQRILWLWLLAPLVLGPPAFAGVAVGHFIGSMLDSVAAGVGVAIVMAGLLSDLSRSALRRAREAS